MSQTQTNVRPIAPSEDPSSTVVPATSRTAGRGRFVRDALAAGTTFSFEFFPAKDEAGEKQLWQALRELEPLQPSFVSVTYGAGGTTRDGTIKVTERVASDTSMVPLAHLTAVNHTIDELRNLVGSMASHGVRNLLALRGDPPGNVEGEWVKHPEGLEYASQVVELFRSLGDFSVGVAAFPFKHPRSPDVETDTARFIDKCRAGADFAITQMFFEADDYLRMRDRVTRAGCNIPIIAGVMPVLSMTTITRAPQLSGAPFPPGLAAEFDAIAHDRAGVRALGIERSTQMCQRLLDEGVPGIHFITMNRSKATREIWCELAPSASSTGTGAPNCTHP